MMKQFSISIIGAGSVGSTTAYALIMRNINATIMLVDCDETRCTGQVYDLVDALPFYPQPQLIQADLKIAAQANIDRKSTRLNSSHEWISYAVFCLKTKRTVRYL